MIWNLHRFPCPQCGRALQARHATAIVIVSGLIGLALAAVAIYFEAIGRWKTLDSLRFFAVALTVYLLPWSWAWRRLQFIPREEA